jgi:2-iminobutanoate/2-iminopropanoate deaminase
MLFASSLILLLEPPGVSSRIAINVTHHTLALDWDRISATSNALRGGTMALDRTVIVTENAPKAVGPYSQGITAGNLLFSAGQIPLDPETGKMVGTTIEEQTHQVLKNLRGVVEAAGSSLDQVVKVTVFLTDLGNFQAMNKVYAEYFTSAPPARSAFQVSALPLGAEIEIECVAIIPSS